MAKIKLTDELSKLIKNTRINNNIKAIELAEYLEKSVAYVNKLENTQFKNVDYDLVINILKFLTKDSKNDFNEFISKTLEKCSIEEANDEEWFIKFDAELRQIPIGSKLIDWLIEKLKELNINGTELISIINENRALQELNLDFNKYDKNTFVDTKEKGKLIIFDFKETLIDDIISKKKKTINHVSMMGIVYNICMIEGLSSIDAGDKANEILNNFKFYNLEQRNELLRSSKRIEERNEILNDYERKNIKCVNNILSRIKVISDWNVDYANKYLSELEKTFETNDPSFSLAVVCRKFYKLEDLNQDDKKNFLKELDDLIKKFENIEHDKIDDFEAY